MEGFVIVIFLIIFGIGAVINWILKSIIGEIRWCENCNTWNKMKLKDKFFICQNCGHSNFHKRGCPECGWYGRYENRYVGRVGPYSEMKDYGKYLLMYKETWNCPKHGNYTVMVPASQSREYYDY